MRVILIEYIWQIDQIVEKNYHKESVIVSLHPECSYILKSKKIKYFETSYFCDHKELWNRYKEINEKTFKITKALDESLFLSDKRFKELNWNFFDDYHYIIKICFDQLFYYSELISKLLQIYKPEEIIVANSNKVVFNDQFILNPNSSILKFILNSLNNSKVKTTYMDNREYNYGKNSHKFSFGQPKYLFILNNLKKKLKDNFYKYKFYFNYIWSHSKYFAVGCYEIERLKKLYPKKTNNILSYYHENLNSKCEKIDKDLIKKFKKNLEINTNYNHLVLNKNISLKFVIDKLIEKLILLLDYYIKSYYEAKKILKRKKPECIIFQSMSPFYSPNVFFRKACKDLNIPFANWVHGGYFTNSLPGYDIVDYRLCNNHISYGESLDDLINDKNCILNKLNFQKKQKIFPVGSARFDYDNKNRIKKNESLNNKKPTILFMAGCVIDKNQFYFGYNREKNEHSLWELHYEILLILKKYQDRYNIIFKDYPNGFSDMWKKVLNDIGATKISYISDKKKINDLLEISDLNIMPWMSTTFFEALYFNADIFLLDDDIYEKPFIQKLSKEIYCFKNEKNFKSSLENYLIEGSFYQTKKSISKKYFLNLENSKNRFDFLNNALIEIKNEKKNYI